MYVIILKLKGAVMNLPISKIGEKLREIRTEKNLSLDEVSQLTQVSKPMLGQIERGQSVPTITTLWKIATGLKTPLSSFLEEHKPDYSVISIDKDNVILEDDGKMRAYPLFAYDPIYSMETFFIEFDSGCFHTSCKHDDGVLEYVFVLSGKLQVVLGETEIIIDEKQSVRFKADISHSYNNPFENICTVYNTIFYPKR